MKDYGILVIIFFWVDCICE